MGSGQEEEGSRPTWRSASTWPRTAILRRSMTRLMLTRVPLEEEEGLPLNMAEEEEEEEGATMMPEPRPTCC